MNLKILTFVFLGSAANAAIEVPLDNKHVIEISISREDLTRIAVKGDRIRNVFGVAGEYVMEADEDQGQVFIRPTGATGVKPIGVTVTTEGGHTQDLRFIPKNQPAEALILKNDQKAKEETEKESQTSLIAEDIARDEVENLFLACRTGRIPLGYKLMPLSLKTLNRSHPLMREIRGEKFRCLTYEVKNTRNASLTLSEPEFTKMYSTNPNFAKRSLIAVLIPQKTLTPGERTAVHVVARAN